MLGGQLMGLKPESSVTRGRLPGVKLRQGALRNPLQHLLGEDSEQLPADVKSFIHCPVIIRTYERCRIRTLGLPRDTFCRVIHHTDVDVLTLRNEVFLKLLEELEVEQVIRGEGLFSDHSLHGLHILTDGITRVLETWGHTNQADVHVTIYGGSSMLISVQGHWIRR